MYTISYCKRNTKERFQSCLTSSLYAAFYEMQAIQWHNAYPPPQGCGCVDSADNHVFAREMVLPNITKSSASESCLIDKLIVILFQNSNYVPEVLTCYFLVSLQFAIPLLGIMLLICKFSGFMVHYHKTANTITNNFLLY